MKKNVHIYIPEGRSVYYANFRARRNDPVKGVITVQVNRSTGSDNRRIAQKNANYMREQEQAGLFESVPKFREDSPTVGQLADRFQERSKLGTADDIVRDFLIVVAEGAGLCPTTQKEKARQLRLSSLTAERMYQFRDNSAQTRAPITINRIMRTAKSIFSKRAMEYYRDLKLPDLKGWMNVAFLPAKMTRSFKRIEDDTLSRMDGAAGMMLRLAEWNSRNPHHRFRWLNAWGCYWLMRRCGLRNSEVEQLRWEWFTREGDKVWLSLVQRPYWSPKGSEGVVPISLDLYMLLLEAFGPAQSGPDGFVLMGSSHDRQDATHREVNIFVRRFLPDRPKGAYELRKQWGSEMARRYGIETAATLLRHKTITMSWNHYFADLKLQAISAL